MTDEKKPSDKGDSTSDEATTAASGKKRAPAKKAAPADKAGNAKASVTEGSKTKSASATPTGQSGASNTKATAGEGKKAGSADKSKPKKKEKMSIEEEKRALDAIITGDSTAEEKKEAIEKLRKLNAIDDIIKVKHHEARPGIEEIKKKASAARKSASEKILNQSYVADADMALERLADTFDKSARRWEMVVYPSMFAFVLLAGYGFYLIYHLTHDIAVLSHSVTRMATIVSDATPKVTSDMRGMSIDMQTMSGELRTMSYQMESLKPMSNNISHMTNTMNMLNTSIYGMQRDMGGLNRTISSGPFGFMNDVFPITSDAYKKPVPPLPLYTGQPLYIQPMMTPPVMHQQPAAQNQQQPQSTE